VSWKTVTKLEEIGSRSWQAKEIEYLGGWQLRADEGITRRANSVLPLDSPRIDMESAVKKCVSFYVSRALLPRFQLTAFSMPSGLDDYLKGSRWIEGLVVDVQTAEIGGASAPKAAHDVELLDSPNDGWIGAYLKGSGHENENPHARLSIMLRSPLPKRFAQLVVDDQIAGVGLGILCEGWLGLYSIATVPGFRKHKVATNISHALLDWGVRMNANHAYLQVEVDNHPALGLYRNLGFRSCYRYWYRDYEKE
jgi:ribosomal protein S18 acetylase RimI-like enzyme